MLQISGQRLGLTLQQSLNMVAKGTPAFCNAQDGVRARPPPRMEPEVGRVRNSVSQLVVLDVVPPHQHLLNQHLLIVEAVHASSTGLQTTPKAAGCVAQG